MQLLSECSFYYFCSWLEYHYSLFTIDWVKEPDLVLKDQHFIAIHHVGYMNVWRMFQGNPFNTYWDIKYIKHRNACVTVGIEKVEGSPTQIDSLSGQHLILKRPVVVWSSNIWTLMWPHLSFHVHAGLKVRCGLEGICLLKQDKTSALLTKQKHTYIIMFNGYTAL